MLVSGVALGILAGIAIRRTWRGLPTPNVRWLPLLAAALAARALVLLVPGLGLPLYVFALAGTAVAAAANTRLPGAAFVALGGALNLAVVLSNAGMPVDPGAILAAGATMPSDALHVPLTARTVVAALSDVVPVAALHAVYSVGDFSIALGGFLVPFVLLIRR